MSYEKQNWVTGEVITANKLNHMEDGIANAGTLICGLTYVAGESGQRRLTKTYGEVKEALDAGKNIMLIDSDAGDYTYYYPITSLQCSPTEDEYYIRFSGLGWDFLAGTSPNDYPTEDMG